MCLERPHREHWRVQVPTEAEVRRVMAEADQSGDGKLDFLEFLALVHRCASEPMNLYYYQCPQQASFHKVFTRALF